MDEVFVVYSTLGDGDSWRKNKSEAICRTIEKAKLFISENIEEKFKAYSFDYVNNRREPKFYPIVQTMNKENNYTYIGNRKDDCLGENLNYLCFGGYIIEKTEVL